MTDAPRPGDEAQDPDPPPEAEGPPPVPRCEVCGAELEPDQTYCLECGAPTPLAPRLRRGGRALALLAGAMVILGAGAGALAYAVASDDDDSGPAGSAATTATAPATGGATVVPPPATGPLPPDTSLTSPTAPATTAPGTGTVTGFETVTGPTPTSPPATETQPTETEPPDAGGGTSDWPAGETAWTALLSSVRSEPDARAAKARLAGSGEPAGVLFSSDYPGLRPGYWVVFSGSYSSESAAEAQARKLSGRFPGGYARRIEG
ncbi:MAG TPA: SPOR domain-containing protein [Miltoncostaeaceae bacterium]|nr:SPOR domain-containing protein [Miltoncostaeaceae bacterium]